MKTVLSYPILRHLATRLFGPNAEAAILTDQLTQAGIEYEYLEVRANGIVHDCIIAGLDEVIEVLKPIEDGGDNQSASDWHPGVGAEILWVENGLHVDSELEFIVNHTYENDGVECLVLEYNGAENGEPGSMHVAEKSIIGPNLWWLDGTEYVMTPHENGFKLSLGEDEDEEEEE